MSSLRAKLRQALIAPMTLFAVRSTTAVRGFPVEPEVVNTRYSPRSRAPMLALSAMKRSTSERVSVLSQTQSSQRPIRVRLSVGGRSERTKFSGTSR